MSDSDKAFHANFHLSVDRDDGRPSEFKPIADTMAVEINNSASHFGSDSRFSVRIRVTAELRKLYDAAMKAIGAAHELRQARTMSTYRADAGRSLIRQAIANLPEGEALLEMMRALRRQIEKKTGKHLLLSDTAVLGPGPS